jgi:hypothetical protein
VHSKLTRRLPPPVSLIASFTLLHATFITIALPYPPITPPSPHGYLANYSSSNNAVHFKFLLAAPIYFGVIAPRSALES